MEFNPNLMIEELEKGLGSGGDLTLIICCTKCDANFELNHSTVAIAIGMNTSFIEYLRFVQSSKCSICHEKKEE